MFNIFDLRKALELYKGAFAPMPQVPPHVELSPTLEKIAEDAELRLASLWHFTPGKLWRLGLLAKAIKRGDRHE